MNNRKAEDGRGKIKFNFISILLYLMLLACCLPLTAFAQAESPIQDDMPTDAAPPPLKIISPDERKVLDAETGIKKRTQLSLEMMEARLMKAEEFTSQDNYKKSLDNLGGYQAILENTLTYLEKNDNNNKADSRFKQFEIFLRKQVPRLETLRRTMPYKFGYYVLKLMKVVRETRAKAVEPLFADSVVPQKKT